MFLLFCCVWVFKDFLKFLKFLKYFEILVWDAYIFKMRENGSAYKISKIAELLAFEALSPNPCEYPNPHLIHTISTRFPKPPKNI